MQTRRDQLHAFRFQNRRALAALVNGEPNAVEPPMRRLTVTTISGIMIAVLVTVGFTVFGLIRPKAGDSWKEGGAVIVEQDTGATYVVLKDKLLHPVENYTSAVLAVGSQQPHTVEVERSDLKSAQRGPRIGIPGLPQSLPDSGDLLADPVAVCSRQVGDDADDVTAKVSVRFGDDADSRRLGTNAGIVVNTGAGTTDYVLANGHRLAVTSADVGTALGISKGSPLQVGTAFLNGVPAGTDLRAPQIPGMGRPSDKVVADGQNVVVGRLLKTSETDFFVVMPDGVAPVNPVQRALLETLPIGPGDTLLAPLETTQTVALAAGTSKAWDSIEADQLAGLPSDLPRFVPDAARNGGVCAIYHSKSTQPSFAVPPTMIPSVSNPGVTESDRSKRGQADEVDLAPGGAALVKSADGSKTVFLVADPGEKFAAVSDDVINALGYGGKEPTTLPAQLLPLIPSGPAMDPKAATVPVDN